MEQTQSQTQSNETFICASCKKEFPRSEAVEKLHGNVLVCKECDNKEKHAHKEGETCEFC